MQACIRAHVFKDHQPHPPWLHWMHNSYCISTQKLLILIYIFAWPLSAVLEFIFHTFILMTPLCIVSIFQVGNYNKKKQVCLSISVILKPLEIRTNLQVFGHLNDLIQIIEDSVDQTVSVPIPTSGPRPRSDHLFLQLLAAWWTW